MLPNELGIAPVRRLPERSSPGDWPGCPMSSECLLPARRRPGQESRKPVRLPRAAGTVPIRLLPGSFGACSMMMENTRFPWHVTPNQPEQGVLSTTQPVLFVQLGPPADA